MKLDLLFDHKFFEHVNQIGISETGKASRKLIFVQKALSKNYISHPLAIFEHILGFLLALPIPMYSSVIYTMINVSRGLPSMSGMYFRSMYYRQKLACMEPNVLIDQNVIFPFPKGVTLKSFCYIDKNVKLLAKKVTIGHRVHIGANVIVSGGGSFKVENYAGIAPNCTFITATESLKNGSRASGPMVNINEREVRRGSILLEKDSFIGVGAIILSDVTIANGSVVGPGCIISKNTEPWKVYGNRKPLPLGFREQVKEHLK